jgi:DNA invertase Pin-like site-specific DNA recombinase
LDHVGAIFGVEMSRLARSCKDWYQLLELCALFGTLICDLDGVYDPSCYNDRLLLGLKGTMSEAELHILKQRMWQGSLNKARRGELVSRVPIGYVRNEIGQINLNPDEQVQSTVRLVFDLYQRLGTVTGILRHLVRNGIQLPFRIHTGSNKGQIEWRRPNQSTIRNMLAHPIYAGAYVYGRSCQTPTTRQRHNARADCHARNGWFSCGIEYPPISRGNNSRRIRHAWRRIDRITNRAAAYAVAEPSSPACLCADAVATEWALSIVGPPISRATFVWRIKSSTVSRAVKAWRLENERMPCSTRAWRMASRCTRARPGPRDSATHR